MNKREMLITEILYLSLLVNSHTDYCVFIRFSGHVDQLEVEICKTKERYQDIVARDGFNYKKVSEKELKSIQDQLTSILNDGEINYDELDYTVIKHNEYHLCSRRGN